LQTATINPAKYLNKDKQLGTVEPGKIADLVLLDGNPVEDIHNLRRLRGVVLNGRFLDREKLDAILPTFP
jgi:imidazolonepropionase-like amidohydrolase